MKRSCGSKQPVTRHSVKLEQWPFSSVACIALVSAAPARADDSATVLSTITVEGKSSVSGPDATIVAKDTASGSKTDTPVIDIPQAVSVVTMKEMETRGVSDMQAAVAYTSGVVTDEFGSDDRYDDYRIRGFDTTTLGICRNGHSAPSPAWYTAARTEPYRLERVEVLKNSTSSLFGLNSRGGMINAMTKRPTDTCHAEVYTTFSENHSARSGCAVWSWKARWHSMTAGT